MAGLEPATYGLQNRCSAIELHRRESLDLCGKTAPIAAMMEVSYFDSWWHAMAPKGTFFPPVFGRYADAIIRIAGRPLSAMVHLPCHKLARPVWQNRRMRHGVTLASSAADLMLGNFISLTATTFKIPEPRGHRR